jgi:hypothetical protein
MLLNDRFDFPFKFSNVVALGAVLSFVVYEVSCTIPASPVWEPSTSPTILPGNVGR